MSKPRNLDNAANLPEGPMFVTWDADDKHAQTLAIQGMANGLKRAEPVMRAHGSQIFNNIAPGNVSIRDGFNRLDYENYRPEEARPIFAKDVIMRCMAAYKQHGLVKNVIDLMADFATQGISVYHQNERIEKWWKEWWRRVHGKERSERFLNLLYRTANVIVKRQMAKINVRLEKDMKASAEVDIDNPLEYEFQVVKREIPWRYTFFNPLSIEVIGDDISSFLGQDTFTFGINIPPLLANKIKNPKQNEKALVGKIPSDIRELIVAGNRFIPLDPQKVSSYYYKKDDWEVWASPLLAPLLVDLNLLDKMKLADMAALDGAISCIRVWKLGDIPNRIMPTEIAINRLAEMLCNNVGGGVMDLVWGPEINLVETNTDVYRFLGNKKYEPILNSIFQGLGIPASLTGSSQVGGVTNNFISLKTLTERLQYGREILRMFWEQEIRIVQKAMGFRFPATLVFDRMVLTDEAAEKQLLLNLADRDLISWESLIERFGETPEIEEARLRRESRKRATGKMPPKASPFHDPQQDFGLKKIFSQTGAVTPSEVGLDLDERDETQVPLADRSQNQGGDPSQTNTDKTKVGVPGRPKQSADKQKRKKKKVTPRTSAAFFEAMAWAEIAQGKILQTVGPAYLKAVGKATMRELTDQETRNFEEFKFRLLCQFPLHANLDGDVIVKAVAGQLGVPSTIMDLLKKTVAKHVDTNGKEPPLEILRRYQSGVYAFYMGDFDEETADTAHGLS